MGHRKERLDVGLVRGSSASDQAGRRWLPPRDRRPAGRPSSDRAGLRLVGRLRPTVVASKKKTQIGISPWRARPIRGGFLRCVRPSN